MTNKTVLYSGLAVLTISVFLFIGSLIYIFAPLFAVENAGIGAISLTYAFLPIAGIILGTVLTIIGFFQSKNKKNLP